MLVGAGAVLEVDTSPRPLASPAPLGLAFTQSASHTTQHHDRSRPSSPFLAFSPDAIARIAPPSWELTMDSVIALDGRPSERSHLQDSGKHRDSLEDTARCRPQESGECRDSSEDVERRHPRGSDGSQSSSEDVEMADVEGEDNADCSPIIRVNKGKKKLNPKPYRVIKKVKLNSSAATKVIRWINRPRPRIVLHNFDSSQGGDEDEEDEEDGDYETAEESFEEKTVRDTLAAGESPVRSSSQITHISATPSPPPSSCTRIFRPLFSDSDLGQTSSQHARATPPFRYLNSAVELSSDLNLHIEFPPTLPSSNAAEPASSQRSTPASPMSSDLLEWEEYTDEQHALIGNLLDQAHKKHVKDLKLD
ncbi:hypothetical protein CVT26_001393 [Gymnopilus dilepis]|uniref:Uncharacterized protein n=1 Tax=Gymnopilus dilepis TaxID=231916 RepID=A0A409X5B6_9AGAR|nr:hypothetical protein CVT26_001393 [Gymnopilus dilepis]